ncbi:hypothetical protein HDU97_009656 [Phlyctochytrium planicorne]|nr:hypothetical protein HDU97_009656 [Phlyctochytrium planicorne]
MISSPPPPYPAPQPQQAADGRDREREEWERLLKQKDDDIVLAANLGQSLLREVERLKRKIKDMENIEQKERHEQQLDMSTTPQPNQHRMLNNNPSSSSSNFTTPSASSQNQQHGWTGSSSPPQSLTQRVPSDSQNKQKPDKVFDRGESISSSGSSQPNRLLGHLKAQRPNLKSRSGSNGQMDLSDNLFLLDSPTTIAQQSTYPSNIDPALAQEIDNSLIKHARTLQQKLAVCEADRASMAEKLQVLEKSLFTVKRQNERFASNEAKLNERLWELETEEQSLKEKQDALESDKRKLKITIRKLQNEYISCKEQLDAIRGQEQNWTALKERLSAKHEAELNSKKRSILSLQNEKLELSDKVTELQRLLDHRIAESADRGEEDAGDLHLEDLQTDAALTETQPNVQDISIISANNSLLVESLSMSLNQVGMQHEILQSENLHLRNEVSDLKRLLTEAQESIEILRYQKARQEQQQQLSSSLIATEHSMETKPSPSLGIEKFGQDIKTLQRLTSEMTLISDDSRSNEQTETIDLHSPLDITELFDQSVDMKPRVSESGTFPEGREMLLSELDHNILDEFSGDILEDANGFSLSMRSGNICSLSDELARSVSKSTHEAPISAVVETEPASDEVIYETQSISSPTKMEHSTPEPVVEETQQKRSATESLRRAKFGGGGRSTFSPHATSSTTDRSTKNLMSSKKEAQLPPPAPPISPLAQKTEESNDTNMMMGLGQFPMSAIEGLTSALIGSWFQKYNRHGKNPKLRFFWVDPYRRCVNWAEAPLNQRKKVTSKSAYIEDIYWSELPENHRNYPPNEEHTLTIRSNNRTIILIPTSWADFYSWVVGIQLLLERSKGNQAARDIVPPECPESDDEGDTEEGESIAESRDAVDGRPGTPLSSRLETVPEKEDRSFIGSVGRMVRKKSRDVEVEEDVGGSVRTPVKGRGLASRFGEFLTPSKKRSRSLIRVEKKVD